MPVLALLLCCLTLGKAPLEATLEWGTEQFVLGTPARTCVVVVENTSDSTACALRSVGWRNGIPVLGWHTRLLGKTREADDGRIEFDPTFRAVTDLKFEHGLLLPGESMRIPLPLIVRGTTHVLELDYVAVTGPGHDLEREVFLPAADDVSGHTFALLTYDATQARGGSGGGPALIRSTMRDVGYLVRDVSDRVELASPDLSPWQPGLTGGMSHAAAVERSGLEQGCGTYLGAIDAWMVQGPDGRTVLLRPDADATAMVRFRTPVPATAAFMMALSEEQAQALLHPDHFSEITRVRTPRIGVHFDPGLTSMDGETLDAVLTTAAEKGVAIDTVTIDPEGFGATIVLSFGVEVDPRGRWIDPAIQPTIDRR